MTNSQKLRIQLVDLQRQMDSANGTGLAQKPSLATGGFGFLGVSY